MDEIEALFSEIVQMRVQYVAEVGSGRRKWPRSIRERVLRLVDLGLRMKQIAARSGVPYETVCQWKYQRDHRPDVFHALPVVAASPHKKVITNVGTVTAPANKIVASETPVAVRTPDGYWIKALSAESAVLVIRSLRGGV